MPTTIFVPPFQDPQLRQFAQQIVSAIQGANATVTVGDGVPTDTRGAVKGDTYWNAADNNFWIYDNNIWNILETGINEDIFFGKSVYYVPPLLSGQWDTTVLILVQLNIVLTSGLTTAVFNIQADVNGNLTVLSYPEIEGLSVNIVNQGTPSLEIAAIHKIGRAITVVKSGSEIKLFSSNMGYDYRYLALRYADSITGTGISVNPVGKRYLGIDNNPTTGSTNVPDNYTWYDLGSSLSSTNKLWVKTGENRIALFKVSASQPDGALYNDLFTTAVTTLDLDNRTGSLIQSTYDAGGTDRTVASTQNEAATFKLPASGPGAQNRLLTSFPSLTIDDQGRIANFGSIDKLYVGFQVYVASSAGQTFNFNHVVGQGLFFLNGILMDPVDYTETTTTVAIPGCNVGDSVRLWRFTKSDPTGTIAQVPFVRTTVPTVAGQTDYTVPFSQGADLLFYNGVFMNDPVYGYQGVNTIRMVSAPTVSGKNLTMVSFNLLSGLSIPFSQFATTTTAGQTLYTVEGTVGPQQYTFLTQNGVAMTSADYATTSTTAAVAGTLTLTPAPVYTDNFLEGTSWQAAGVATLSSGIGATTARTLQEGMLLANGETIKEVGEEDPSKNGMFTKVELPKSIGELFEELQERIAVLEEQLRQGGSNGTRI